MEHIMNKNDRPVARRAGSHRGRQPDADRRARLASALPASAEEIGREDMASRRRLVAAIVKALRRERVNAGRAGYDLERHAALAAALRQEGRRLSCGARRRGG